MPSGACLVAALFSAAGSGTLNLTRPGSMPEDRHLRWLAVSGCRARLRARRPRWSLGQRRCWRARHGGGDGEQGPSAQVFNVWAGGGGGPVWT
jgi:hypothetical protein